MSSQVFELGFERKIGYSFLGLLAGNAASLSALLVIATLQSFPVFDSIRHFWWITIPRAFGISAVFAIFSLAGWTVVGLPFVLLLPAHLAARIHWLLAAPVGAVLGAVSMGLMFTALDRGLDWTKDFAHQTVPQSIGFFAVAILISGIAMAVYCGLLRSEFRDWAIKNRVPSGPPQSFVI